ncbi:MAG TPA: hypothetical protein VGM56_11625 [Byssovorax sp.]|jgi:hypothetical protein
MVTKDDGTRRPACPGNAAPIGVASALVAGDEHAKGVCASRGALYARMDEEARGAFAAAFDVCSTH